MNSSVHHVLVACLVMVVAVRVSAQDASAEAKDFLESHNEYRAEVGSPPLQWNETMAEYARSWGNQRAEDCQMIRTRRSPYGENMVKARGNMSVRDAVKAWYSEKEVYDPVKNRCTCSNPMGCSHYTQLVWKASTQIGCAKVQCTKGLSWFMCCYSPPGNQPDERPL